MLVQVIPVLDVFPSAALLKHIRVGIRVEVVLYEVHAGQTAQVI